MTLAMASSLEPHGILRYNRVTSLYISAYLVPGQPLNDLAKPTTLGPSSPRQRLEGQTKFTLWASFYSVTLREGSVLIKVVQPATILLPPTSSLQNNL